MSKKYTWEQIEEALSVAGVSSNKVRRALAEAVNYSDEAEEGPDPEGQEKLEPRAPAEKAWADQHRIQVFDPVPETKDGTERAMSVTNADEPSTQTAPKPEVNVSFDRIRKMMS